MTVEVRRAEAADIPELGRICYEAFKDIAESHGFESEALPTAPNSHASRERSTASSGSIAGSMR